MIPGGHGGTHRHLTALADDEDFDEEERAAMKPKSIEDGTATPAVTTVTHSHNGIKDTATKGTVHTYMTSTMDQKKGG